MEPLNKDIGIEVDVGPTEIIHEDRAFIRSAVNAQPLPRPGEGAMAQELIYEVETKDNLVKAKPTAFQMAKNLAKSAIQAAKNGGVSREIYDERMATCRACPMFDANEKRCNMCGCFMEAKNWIGGDKDNICPDKKFKR